MSDLTVAEAREALRRWSRTCRHIQPNGSYFYCEEWNCSACCANQLLDLLDREDEERRQRADNLLDTVYRTSCGHEWTVRHTACPICFGEMRAELASLRNVAAGEYVECDDEIPWEAGG